MILYLYTWYIYWEPSFILKGRFMFLFQILLVGVGILYTIGKDIVYKNTR